VDFAEINGKKYPISRIASGNRTASARLRGGSIVISIPSRWPPRERERISAGLLRRALKAIEAGRWSDERESKVRFFHGQRVEAMGRRFEIAFKPSKRFGSRVRGGMVEVAVIEGHPGMEGIASRLARKRIVEAVMPQLAERVRAINAGHFGAAIPGISVRDNISRWGSCSRNGSISLNVRLLFHPGEILDYVIVHELAHTKYRSHGPRFWALVEKIVPDHREKRAWLRENGWKAPCLEEKAIPEDDCLQADFFEEPY
jgi:predicted metal-dependent hydrolase